MKKLMSALFGAMVCIAASAEVLPSWAVGTYKGTFVNWCEAYDDPDDIGPWYSSSAKLTVGQDGKISGEVRFGALKGTPQGAYVAISSTEDSIVLSLKWRWYEKGDVDELGLVELILRNTSSGVEMEYVDKEMLENKSENPYESENCPVAGTLTKTSSGPADETISAEWQKARILRGVATRAMPNPVVGIFELKCGKANKKTGIAKVSATLIGIDGKKKAYKAASVDVRGSIVAVDFDSLSIAINGGAFNGSEGVPGGLSVKSSDVGGNWTKPTVKVSVYADDLSMFAGMVLSDLMPANETAKASGSKWSFNKAASVKWVKPKKGAPLPEIYDAASGKGLVIDTSRGKNLSGLKLTYTPKTGMLKGAFKMYALDSGKLRKYTVKVTGVVVDGVGYGIATCKKPTVSWTVMVE